MRKKKKFNVVILEHSVKPLFLEGILKELDILFKRVSLEWMKSGQGGGGVKKCRKWVYVHCTRPLIACESLVPNIFGIYTCPLDERYVTFFRRKTTKTWLNKQAGKFCDSDCTCCLACEVSHGPTCCHW